MNTSRWMMALVSVVALAVVLLLSSCRSGSDFGTALPSQDNPGSPKPSQSAATEPSPDAPASAQSTVEASLNEQPLTSSEKEEAAKIDAVTEVASYDVKNTCKKDAAGVVRVFDEEGKKSVYRPFCDGKSLMSFSCEDKKARASSSNCANGCMLDESRNAVCRKSPIPPRNPDPTRTGGQTLDRTLGTNQG